MRLEWISLKNQEEAGLIADGDLYKKKIYLWKLYKISMKINTFCSKWYYKMQFLGWERVEEFAYVIQYN